MLHMKISVCEDDDSSINEPTFSTNKINDSFRTLLNIKHHTCVLSTYITSTT